jgi:branched-chain amino acid transport system substrate-binding protein
MRDVSEGTLMTFSPDPRRRPAAAEVVQRLRARNIDPEGCVLHTYAAIQC